jgi:hypothetical protein
VKYFPPAVVLAGLMGLGGLLGGCLFTGDGPEPADITPLAVGNTWVYVDSVYYGDDSVVVSTAETSILGTRDVTVEGEKHTVFLSNGHAVGGPPSPFSAYVKNIGHGNYNFGGEQDTARVLGKVLHLEYPTRKGRRYPTYFYSFTLSEGNLVPVVDTIHIEVVDPDHTCTVPAGTFACVQYRGYFPNGDLFATAYHAPGVGPLGSEIVRAQLVGDSLREVRSIRRLVSFILHQ